LRGEQDRQQDYVVAADLICSRKVLVDPIISQEYKIDGFDQGFRTADDPSSSVKVVFKIG
jgi:threonine dehydrogenase-like Zn-dependent dehydrogenase